MTQSDTRRSLLYPSHEHAERDPLPAAPEKMDELASRVRGEYREMPGLQLTHAQACRLWQVDRATCDAIVEQLIRENFLRLMPNGTYVALPSNAEPLTMRLGQNKRLRQRTG